MKSERQKLLSFSKRKYLLSINDLYCYYYLHFTLVARGNIFYQLFPTERFLWRLRENLFRHQTIVLTQINFYPERYELAE